VAAEGELDGGQNIVKALSCFENKLVSDQYLMAFVDECDFMLTYSFLILPPVLYIRKDSFFRYIE
jgi:hypothetical protein